ncbi:MAG: aminotransferase class IV, partial [Nitrososphaeria archaeon]
MSKSFEARFIWQNGSFVPWQEAKVHVMTNALHYGTGVFEGIRAYWNGKQLYVFRLQDHVNRFFNSIKIYGFGIDFSKDQISEGIKETLRKNEL